MNDKIRAVFWIVLTILLIIANTRLIFFDGWIMNKIVYSLLFVIVISESNFNNYKVRKK